MTDSEKVALIRKVISDFWEYNDTEQVEKGSVCILTAVQTVVEFGGETQNAE